MTLERYEEIRDKLKNLETKKIKAETSMETIMKLWKKENGINSLEEAEELQEKLELEKNSLEEKLEKLGEKIEDITDWDRI